MSGSGMSGSGMSGSGMSGSGMSGSGKEHVRQVEDAPARRRLHFSSHPLHQPRRTPCPRRPVTSSGAT
ncbi:hypothetical protein E4P43_07735 [Blastococcus sp. TF02A-35]|nr:hypothetical protein E4P43_07735 [Blastococcus sp. TF02A_35]